MVCPSTGCTGTVEVGGSGVADGRGVCVGGNVAVMKSSGVGVGVSGTGGSALQAVPEKIKTARTMKMSEECRGLVDTILLYPRLGCTW